MSVGWGAATVPALLGVSTLALLATRSLRADGVALLALAAAVLLGLVSPDEALSGLADPVVVTVAALAILASAVHRSGVIDLVRGAITRRFRPTVPVLLACGGLVALLAAVSGRTGTRAAVLPTVLRPQSGPGEPAGGRLLLSVACLLGSLMTVVGGVPNLLVSSVRRDMTGAAFDVLAFLPLGATLLAAGLILAGVGAAITRRGALAPRSGPADDLRRVKSFTSEVVLPATSPMARRTVGALEGAAEGTLRVVALVREGFRRLEPRSDWALEGGDLLVLDCEPGVLQRLMERFDLHTADGPLTRPVTQGGTGMVEAVVTQSSALIGTSSSQAGLLGRHGIHLLAIGRNDDHPRSRLHRTRLRAGDILLLSGEFDALPASLASLGCLLLAERRLRAGRRQQIVLPVVTLLAALAIAAVTPVPLWLCLLVGVLIAVLARVLTLQEAYDACPWPGLVMLGSLIPLGAALHRSPAAAALAHVTAPLATATGPGVAVGVAVATTMAATWLFGSAAAVLLVSPFAAAVSLLAGTSPDMLLAAVAVGAAVDMLDGRGLVAAMVPGPGLRGGWGWRDGLAAACLLLCGTAAVVALRGP